MIEVFSHFRLTIWQHVPSWSPFCACFRTIVSTRSRTKTGNQMHHLNASGKPQALYSNAHRGGTLSSRSTTRRGKCFSVHQLQAKRHENRHGGIGWHVMRRAAKVSMHSVKANSFHRHRFMGGDRGFARKMPTRRPTGKRYRPPRRFCMILTSRSIRTTSSGLCA